MKNTFVQTFAPIAFAAAGMGSGAAAADPVAEIVTFRLLPDADPAAFVAAANAIEPALRATGKVLMRNLSQDSDGLWTDYIIWTSMEAAKSGAETVMADPAFGPFGAMISGDGMVMRHAAIALQMQ